MEGWIKLHRDISNHWIFENEKYLKWWITILMNVNFEYKKFPVGNEIITCEPGQSFRSLESWAVLFSCSKKTVINFFSMVEKDGMIKCGILGKGNQRKHLVSVVNWSKFQEMETENYTETVPKNTPKQYSTLPPNKNDKNIKNEKNINSVDKSTSLIPLPKSEKIVSIITKCRTVFENRFSELFEESYSWSAKDAVNMKGIIQKIKKRRIDKGFGVEDDDITDAFKSFLDCISDEWILSNFSIAIINSKFNEIISQANGKNKRNNPEPKKSAGIKSISFGKDCSKD